MFVCVYKIQDEKEESKNENSIWLEWFYCDDKIENDANSRKKKLENASHTFEQYDFMRLWSQGIPLAQESIKQVSF